MEAKLLGAPGGERRIIGLLPGLLILAVLAAVLVFMIPGQALAIKFPDVADDDWFAEAVDVLSDNGVINGKTDGTFRPYDPITRAEFSVLVSRCLGLAPGQEHPFVDFPAGSWFEPAVAALYQAGLANGVSERTFAPEGRVSRQQAASFVMRALTFQLALDPVDEPEQEEPQPQEPDPQEPDPQEPGPGGLAPGLDPDEAELWLQGFPDRSFIASAHRLEVADAYRFQIVSGKTDGRFYPSAEVTRAQTAGMLYEALFKVPEPLTEYPLPTSTSEPYPNAGSGSRGQHVLWLEQRLTQLTYRPGTVDGVFDERTRMAVIAFQKWEGLGRDGVVGPNTWARLAAASRPVASQSGSGIWIEVSLARQVFLYIQNGVVTRTLPTSTGRSFTYRSSPYTVQRKAIADGPRYRALYLNPGYVLAIHGYPSIPVYPASDGCVRLPMWEMDALRANDSTNPMIPNGTKVYIR